MSFEIGLQAGVLSGELALAKMVASSKILQKAVLLVARGGNLSVVSTDTWVSLSSSIPDVAVSDGSVSTSADKLYAVVSSFRGGDPVSVREESGSLIVKSGASRFKLPLFNPEDFPSLPRVTEKRSMRLGADVFSDVVRKVAFATTEYDSRYHLHGVLLESYSEGLRAVATDGHRLSLLSVLRTGAESMRVLVPHSALKVLSRIIRDPGSDVSVSVGQNHVTFSYEGRTLLARIPEGNFPDYLKIIRAKDNVTAVVGKEAVLSAVRRVSGVSDDKRSVRFSFKKGGLTVSVKAPDAEASETLDAEYSSDDDADIAFNPKYVTDFLKAVDAERVSIGLKGPDDSATLRPVGDDSHVYVLMPVRL